MATLANKALFFTTSPRSPEKMLPEIKLLCEKFGEQPWNATTQESFINELAKTDFFEGKGSPKDKAFSARDRINRAPKALGFVDLFPVINLSSVGRALIYGKRPQEVFLRQLLKFQLPSPFHREDFSISGTFWVRPYLEIMRLSRDLDGLSFDELKIFAMQLTDYRRYDVIKDAILDFRAKKIANDGNYKLFASEVWSQSIQHMYENIIRTGKTKTRESADATLENFISTKKSNARDYADACFRYLRFTGLFAFKGHLLVVSPDKEAEVSYILETMDRNPVYVSDEQRYKMYLFVAAQPALYTDNKENLIDTLMRLDSYTKRELSDLSLDELKDIRDDVIEKKRDALVKEQEVQLKSYALYQDVIDTFNEISAGEVYDAPLFLEWNTWRAMTMIDGGDIRGNFKLDDSGRPLSTAQGNMPDIECDYGSFALSVEVTLQSGQRQYEAEGEPVTRHYGKLLKKTEKDTYCLFIAPTVNPATLAHFFVTNKTDISYYGGKTRIVPLELDQFMMLVENSYAYQERPTPADIRSFLDSAIAQLDGAQDEDDWRDRIRLCVRDWLVARN